MTKTHRVVTQIDELLKNKPKLACEKHSRILIGKDRCVECEPTTSGSWEEEYEKFWDKWDKFSSQSYYYDIKSFIAKVEQAAFERGRRDYYEAICRQYDLIKEKK